MSRLFVVYNFKRGVRVGIATSILTMKGNPLPKTLKDLDDISNEISKKEKLKKGDVVIINYIKM